MQLISFILKKQIIDRWSTTENAAAAAAWVLVYFCVHAYVCNQNNGVIKSCFNFFYNYEQEI